jgi:LysM repeat protein
VPSSTHCPNEIMKLPTFFPRKKLRATTARRSLGVPDEMDYEQMSEPNMKLSRALLIVLVLHVVAVAGIIAFNTIKTRQGPSLVVSSTSPNATQTAFAKAETGNRAVAASSARRDESRAAHSPAKPIAKDDRRNDHAKPAETAAAKSDSSKTYVVAKGDNPVTIARKFKITYDDLIAANQIEDPHKLQIGQKLIIPVKPAKPKKSGE